MVLVDTSPDLREQLLRAGVERLDGIVLTHPHADHTQVIDDVRPLTLKMRKRLALYMDADTAAVVRRSFAYIFESPPGSLYPPLLDDIRIAAGGPVRLNHGEIDALGLRIGGTAYTPDVSAIPADSLPFVQNLDVWIIDALRPSRHPSHFSLDEALEWVARTTPRHSILTNLHTDMDYMTLRGSIPPGVDVAYDGMSVLIG